MREIEFRAYHRAKGIKAHQVDTIDFASETVEVWIGDYGEVWDFKDIDLLPYINQKDTHGVKIFEGDRVNSYGKQAEVVYNPGNCAFMLKGLEKWLCFLPMNIKAAKLELICGAYEWKAWKGAKEK